MIKTIIILLFCLSVNIHAISDLKTPAENAEEFSLVIYSLIEKTRNDKKLAPKFKDWDNDSIMKYLFIQGNK